MDISNYRQEIDKIDDQMLALFVERMQAAKNIAEAKREQKLPVINPAREREILVRLAKNAGPELSGYVQMLYATLFDVSRAYQYLITSEPGSISQAIRKAKEESPQALPQIATVAIQGIEGAYSGMAAEKCFKLPDITWFKSFQGVAQAVEMGLCQYGLLPVENSTYGTVDQVYDLMQQHKFSVVKSIKLHVSHSLIANKNTKFEQIKEIISHPQAIGQCEKFLYEHPEITVTTAENTAMAAKMVADSGRNDIAAIGSKNCAALYNLEVIKDAVQDNANNYTRFIVITKDISILPGASRISLILSLPHRPGALYSIIAKFAALGLNLLKLESRPAPGSDFEFRFYFDLAAPEFNEEILKLIDELENELDTLIFLGWYDEA
jgi:chorismate mutase/prephenate dehydratase